MRDFIRGLREDELPLFLRFVTGQDILPHQPIRLMFNRLEGILRRPIAHTCSNLLELSLCYETIQQFSREFKVILCDPASYVMDSASGADLGGGCRGCAPPPTSEMTCGFLIQLVFCKKKTMWFIGVEVEQETSGPPPKKILDPPLCLKASHTITKI